MVRDTLVDFFNDFAPLGRVFLVHDDGYRTRRFTYEAVGGHARRFADRLAAAGIGPGDKVVIWGENRPEWIVALWGVLLRGAVLVPLDYRASADFLHRIVRIVSARLVLVGDEVTLDPSPVASAFRRTVPAPAGTAIWRLSDVIEAASGFDPALVHHSSLRSVWSPIPGSGRSLRLQLANRLGLQASGTSELTSGGTVNDEAITRDTVAEIIFTSGATADPKGVVITHRNVLANIVPIEGEIAKYRKYGRIFFPIRFLNLLPLSHMFGQAMATFIPPMLPGEVIFMHGFSPDEIVRQIRTRRVSVLVCVPKILEVLRDYVIRRVPEAAQPPPQPLHWLRRWWYYRRAHRLLGLKFWSFVVGAAPLPPELEEFWGRLGFVVIQGYGLTETAPIVTLNHPFRTRKGTVGKPMHGVDVKIAPDGEILVKGENVTTGYFNADADTRAAFEDGWFHTGDIGEMDAEGGLTVRGRKKEMIVTPEGLNVYPDDVERVLNATPGVRESAVVGVATAGQERVHAVVVTDPALKDKPSVDLDAILREVNPQLEDHQRIRGITRWPADALPRTEGTRKLKRAEVRRWLSGETSTPAAAPRSESVEAILARFAGNRGITGATTLEELGLSSLERLELMMSLEERYQTTLDEASFSQVRSVDDLRALVEQPSTVEATGEIVRFPSWNRSFAAHGLRRVSLPTWILPLARLFLSLKIEGREHLDTIAGPVVFAANHQSHMDTPAILIALPRKLRYRVAPAMAKEFFKAHFFPDQHTRKQWLTNSLNYYLAALFFNAFPLPQREAGTRQTLRYIGEVMADGYSVLIFPEGKRTETGEINHFMPGIGMIASRLGVPVVPVRLEGLEHVLHHRARMARRGSARIAFGAPMRLEGDDYAALARQVEEAVRAL